LSDEHSSQLGAINAGQAVITTSVINLIGYLFDIAKAKKDNQLFRNKEIIFFSTNFGVVCTNVDPSLIANQRNFRAKYLHNGEESF